MKTFAHKAPKAPTFMEHWNGNMQLVILTSCIESGQTIEERYSFAFWFGMLLGSEGDTRYWEIMKAFDEVGYYETTTPNGLNGVNGFYPTTMFPETDNYRDVCSCDILINEV